MNEHPKAKEVAETYGTKENEFTPELVIKWKAALKGMVGGSDRPTVRLRGAEEYTSPLDDQLFEAWGRKAGDPEVEVPRWIREGAPLGIAKEIGCCGIFPEGEEARNNKSDALGPDELEDAQAQLARGEILNYKTVEDDKAEAKIELDRYHLAGYTVKYSKQQVKEKFPGGTISRLGLIVKLKEGGVKKRRIILDLRRSGGNKKAKLPERLVLPRPKDAISMVRDAYSKTNWQRVEEGEEKAMELVVIDIADAFMALPVHREEHQHTLAPGLEKDEYLSFVALLFGYKVAPLLWSRVASMVARLIQSVVPGYRGQHQCYLDDSLWVLTGTLKQRTYYLSFILHTMAAMGLRVSLSKGERAASVQWIGVKFTLQQDYLLVTLPEKFMLEVKEMLQAWEGQRNGPGEGTPQRRWQAIVVGRNPAKGSLGSGYFLLNTSPSRSRLGRRKGGRKKAAKRGSEEEGSPLSRGPARTSPNVDGGLLSSGADEASEKTETQGAQHPGRGDQHGCIARRIGRLALHQQLAGGGFLQQGDARGLQAAGPGLHAELVTGPIGGLCSTGGFAAVAAQASRMCGHPHHRSRFNGGLGTYSTLGGQIPGSELHRSRDGNSC